MTTGLRHVIAHRSYSPNKSTLLVVRILVMAGENDDFIHEIEQLLLQDGIGEEVKEGTREQLPEEEDQPKTG